MPALQWHIIDHDRPFELFGVTITPLPVYHGFAQMKNQLEPFYNLGYMFDQDLIWVWLPPTSVLPVAPQLTSTPKDIRRF